MGKIKDLNIYSQITFIVDKKENKQENRLKTKTKSPKSDCNVSSIFGYIIKEN